MTTHRPCSRSSPLAAGFAETAERTPPGLVYTLASLFIALVLPGLIVVMAYGIDSLSHPLGLKLSVFATVCLSAPIPFCLGYILARQAPLPLTLFRRFFPMLAPLWLLLAAAGPVIWWMQSEVRLLALLLAALAMIYGLYVLGFAWKSERRQASALRTRGLAWLCGLFLLAGSGMGAGWHAVSQYTLYDDPSPPIVGYGVDTRRYQPFTGNNLLAVPAAPSTLRIAANHPRLDGAIALLPVYGAVAQAVYAELAVAGQENSSGLPPLHAVVHCRNTPAAYQALIDDRIDLFFGMPPSAAQLEAMKRQGLQPVIKPIAREAFVFFVHPDNPVGNLSQNQIRAIYTRNVTNWRQVGGADAAIMPFQRPEGSGSQSAMRQVVMREQALARPLRHEYQTGRGDIVNQVADYRNWPNALGYSFRWYATEQFPSEAIRFLSVDNVLPTPETIRDGSYPYIVPLVVVSCRPLSRESKELIDWLTGAEGQALIARTGYVPLQ